VRIEIGKRKIHVCVCVLDQRGLTKVQYNQLMNTESILVLVYNS
jgi:hypothetical protein